jgi:hypothetical protein
VIEALNFTTKALADLAELEHQPALGAADREGVAFIADMLSKAEVFVLPDAGMLLTRDKPRPQVPGVMFHPPFPVVALEYRAVETGRRDNFYEATTSSRRIALAWLFDGKFPGGKTYPDAPKSGSGVVVASICYFDEIRRWVPVAGATMVPFDAIYAKAGPSAYREAMLKTGRINRAQFNAEALQMEGVVALMPEWLGRTVRQHGWQTTMEMISADLMDEVNAYLDMCIALACTNVSTQRCPQPVKLNRARMKAGKVPLKDFHILNLAGDASLGSAGGTQGASRRAHLRRGHVRRLSDTRVTWVNSCIVGGSKVGFVEKNYALKGGLDVGR